jgi:TRAP transporter TAXI family solute receptor
MTRRPRPGRALSRWTRVAVVALLLAGGAVAGGTVACGSDRAPHLDRFVIATGPAGSVYDALGQALARVAKQRWGVDARAQTTAASVENLRLVAEGRADIAFATVDAAAAAVQGDAPFSSALPVVALAGLYDDYLHVVVRGDSGIGQIGDLNGRVVSTGPPGSGTDIVAARVLEAGGFGIDRVDRRALSTADAAEALRGKAIDAFFTTGGLPDPAVAALADRMPITIVPLDNEVPQVQERHSELYVPRAIPRGLYGLKKEVPTLGVRNVIVVRWDLAEEVAYWATKLLFAAKPEMVRAHTEARRLDPRSAVATAPMPLHPGAQRYYRTTKPMADR